MNKVTEGASKESKRIGSNPQGKNQVCIGEVCGKQVSFSLRKYLGVKLLGCTVSMFNFIRKCQTVFQTNYHSGLKSPVACTFTSMFCCQIKKQTNKPSAFLIVWWYFIVILNCIFHMIKDFEHDFMCLFATYISSLVKGLFKLFF